MEAACAPQGSQDGEPVETRPANTPNACIPCRKVKMKCRPSNNSPVCLRCQRKKFDCFYESHRRGRKVGTKLRGRMQPPGADDTIAAGPGTSRQVIAHLEASHPPRPKISPASEGSSAASPTDFILQGSRTSQLSQESRGLSRPAKDNKVDGLSPFRLLNKHAMAGSFSVENVLEAEVTSEAGGKPHNAQQKLIKHSIQEHRQDPVALGIITLPSAMQLFDSFLKYMAPYIIHFDPALHTYDYVQRRSAFLLTTILSASAKIFNPDLHRKLHQHSEALLAKAFSSGEKSIEIAKAILMLTYWKEPDDTRVWQLVGYACRMCVELRGRRTHARNTDPKAAVVDLIKLRERRNVERIWLTLFVYDRSLSLQLGKQWMLHIDDLTRRADVWYRHELVIPSGDAILASFVELRVLSSDLLDILDIDSSSSNQQQHEMLLNMFNTDLDKWESKWREIFDQLSLEPCHLFLYQFYGLHTRLYINSLRLQIMLVHMTGVVKRSLWLSYTSALGMLQAIVDILAPAQLLYYAQDSIHVMTAYAAVFLVKILLSMPEALPAEAEEKITSVLGRTSEAFGAQCASPTTGCAYQARFLGNVVTQYWSSKASQAEPAERRELKQTRGRSTNQSSSAQEASTNFTGHIGGLGSRHTTSGNDGFDSTVRASMFPYVENTMDFNNQPFWHQNVMDPDVWEGLLTDVNFYANNDEAMLTSPF